jgi:hypothetical protein
LKSITSNNIYAWINYSAIADSLTRKIEEEFNDELKV